MKLYPQLRMRHRLQVIPPQRLLPTGFEVRVAVSNDASGISRVLDNSFDEAWDANRVLNELTLNPDVPVTFVIEREGNILAAASYQLKEEPDPDAGWLHWVGVHPEARGIALGEIVSHRVLCEALDRDRTCVMLTTDDYRIPAIKTYLRLGFEPDCCHESHTERWSAVKKTLMEPCR